MADPKRVDPSAGGIGNIAELLNLLGGQKATTTTTADTGALQGVLGQLQNADYQQLLQSIFQQAGGAIPGLQAARANAVGARTGGNSVAATAMDKLLQDTVIKAQQQIAQQQLANQNLQIQAGQGIAGATRNQTTKQGTNLGQAGTILGVGQGLSKLFDSNLGKQALQKGKNVWDTLTGGFSTGAESLGSATGPVNFGGQSGIGDFNYSGIESFDSSVGDWFSGGMDLASSTASSFWDTPMTFADSFSGDTGGFFADLWDGFADGGLVGRDDKRSLVRRHLEEAEKKAMGEEDDASRAAAIKAANAKQKQNPKLNEYDKDSKYVDKKTGIRFANGGSVDVRSGGGRRSSAPSYTPNAAVRSQAVQSPQGILNPAAFAMSPQSQRLNPEDVLGGDTPNNDGQSTQGLTLGNVANALGMAGLTMANPAMALANMMDQAMAQQTNTAVTPGFQTGMAIAQNNPIGLAKGLMALANMAMGTGIDPDGTTSTTPTNGFTSAVAEAMNADMGESDGGNSAGFGGLGGIGDSIGSIGGDAGAAGFGMGIGGGFGVGAGGDGEGGWKSGGEVDGPGTGTSDSIKARLSDGEYVMPADVVEKLGVDFFDNLRAQFHKTAGV